MKFSPARASQPILALTDQVQNAGLSGDDFRELLWLINAHPDLLGFDQIAENLHTLFRGETFRTLDRINQPWTGKIESWRSTLQWIMGNRSALSEHPDLKVIYNHDTQDQFRHPVSRFGLIRHGVYACLWNRHESGGGKLSETKGCLAYQRLQTQLCIAHMGALSNYSTLSEFESYDQEGEFCGKPIQVYSTSYVVRELSWSKYLPLLDNIAAEDDFLSYQQEVSRLELDRTTISGIDPKIALDFVKKLSSYLAQVTKILITGKIPGISKVSSGTFGGRGGGKIHHGYVNISDHVCRVRVEPEDEVSNGFGPLDVVYLRSGDEESDQERGGDAPMEFARPILALYSTEEFGAAMGRAKYSERIRTVAAQRFPWNDNQLTCTEVGSLVEELDATWNRYLQMDNPRIKDTEFCQGALLIWVMLNFGVTLEAARNLRWRKADTLPVSEFAILQGDQCISWRIPGVSPDYRTELDNGYASTNRPMARSFEVPDLSGLGQKIMEFRHRTGRDHERVFSFEPKTALANVQAVIKTIGDPSRLTISRIGRVLENQVYAQTGDMTLAWCVCGNVTEKNKPRMFYTVYPVQKLVNVYCESIAHCYGGTINLSSLKTPNSHDYIGARFVARSDVVQKLVSTIKVKLKGNTSLLHWDRVRQYHNTYTFYAWLVQSFSTAMRAINDPSELMDQEETRKSPVYGLADKETVYRDRARPVFRSELLEKQFAEYRRHREYLVHAFGYQKQTLRGESGPLRLFYLDGRGESQPMTRRWIEEQLEELGYPMPGNFHRAFIRTELLESGCPVQAVDAFMGHASKGESPFDHYSSFEYRQFLDSIAGYQEGLLKTIGLVALISRLSS